MKDLYQFLYLIMILKIESVYLENLLGLVGK